MDVEPSTPKLGPPRGAVSSVSLLRLWLWGSATLIALLIIWVVAPILFFVLALTAGVGLVCLVPIKIARLIEARRGGHGPDEG